MIKGGTVGSSGSPQTGWLNRALLFLAILALCLLVFFVFSYVRPLLPKPWDAVGRGASAVVLLAAALIARRGERTRKYWPILFALFTALCAMSVDYYLLLGQRVARAAGIAPDTPAGWAVDKLGSSLTIVAFVVALWLACGKPASLRIRKGRLGLGLAVGLAAFAIAAATSLPVAALLFKGRDLGIARVLPWTPWLLIFVLANASAEELLFRGLFLGRLEPFFGRFASSFLIAIPFYLLHYGVPYSSSDLAFVAVLIPLALAWGWLMQKTDSIWGSILFHAGMDIPVIVGIFSNLPGA
jgi:membrane protease YdiL (CAAX protease family)